MERSHFDPERTVPYLKPEETEAEMLDRVHREIAQKKLDIENALFGLYQEPVKVLDYERLYEYEDREMYRVKYDKNGEAGELIIESHDGKLDVLPS
jgi:hypothetical protein